MVIPGSTAAVIVLCAILSGPAPAFGAHGGRAAQPLRDEVVFAISNLQPAPASLSVKLDQSDARVLDQRVLAQAPETGQTGTAGVELSGDAGGFSVQAAQVAATSVWARLELRRPGSPITGQASLPAGAAVSVSLPDGSQRTIHDGRFSIPAGVTGLGSPGAPQLSVRPDRASAGDHITVIGNVGAKCGLDDRLNFTSDALAASSDSQPAAAPVMQHGAFSASTRIPQGLDPGRYAIRASCGGKDLGVKTRLRVHPHSRGEVTPPETDNCAPGETDTYVCTDVGNSLPLTWDKPITLFDEWQSCGGVNPPGPALAIAPGKGDRWRASCAVGFWGTFSYFVVTPPNKDGFRGYGFVTVSYSTFSGDSECTGDKQITLKGVFCVAGNSPMIPVNGSSWNEGWHYDNLAAFQQDER